MIVYKYLPPTRIDVLEHSRIRFTQPAVLNDPFETFPCFLEYGPWLLDKINQRAIIKFGMQVAKETSSQRQSVVVQTLLDLPKTLSKYFVILSMSKIRDNLLMWSHYSDSHKGFVIGFDSSSTFFSPGAGKARDGLKSVRYSKHRYVIPKNGLNSVDDPNLLRANAQLFFTKDPCWIYEKEMRILAHPDSADVVLSSSNEYDIRLYNFPKECVKEVIIGFKMIESDQRRVFDLVHSNYKGGRSCRNCLTFNPPL
jgi:hypothetical protein